MSKINISDYISHLGTLGRGNLSLLSDMREAVERARPAGYKTPEQVRAIRTLDDLIRRLERRPSL